MEEQKIELERLVCSFSADRRLQQFCLEQLRFLSVLNECLTSFVPNGPESLLVMFFFLIKN